jgi:hypothetical protein
VIIALFQDSGASIGSGVGVGVSDGTGVDI